MLESVEFQGTADNPYSIRLVRPDRNGIVINGIEGLGAGQAELHMQGRASMDGDVINGARLPARNLVFDFGYGPGLDPYDGRELSYELFPLKAPIDMVFTTDRRVVTITGYVESNEPDIFTHEPGFEVSIVCGDPYFRSVLGAETVTRLFNLESKFEFPFKNDSLTEKLLVLGEYADHKFVELLYAGNASNGALFRLLFNGPVTNPSVLSERTNEIMRINTVALRALTGDNMQAGDVIEIHTVRGQRWIHLLRNGRRINILNALDFSSNWITLHRGLNPISIYADSNVNNFQVEIINDSLYSGL